MVLGSRKKAVFIIAIFIILFAVSVVILCYMLTIVQKKIDSDRIIDNVKKSFSSEVCKELSLEDKDIYYQNAYFHSDKKTDDTIQFEVAIANDSKYKPDYAKYSMKIRDLFIKEIKETIYNKNDLTLKINLSFLHNNGIDFFDYSYPFYVSFKNSDPDNGNTFDIADFGHDNPILTPEQFVYFCDLKRITIFIDTSNTNIDEYFDIFDGFQKLESLEIWRDWYNKQNKNYFDRRQEEEFIEESKKHLPENCEVKFL